MNPYDYTEEKHMSPRHLVDFTLCANPLGPSNKARTAMRKIVREVGVFPDDKARYLRRFLSRKEGIPEGSFVFGHGSSHILSLYLQALRPATMSLPWPYSAYRTLLLEQHGATCEPLPLVRREDCFVIDPEPLLSHAAQGKTLLLPHPHDPTGATPPEGLIDNLLKAVEQSGGMLIIDEAFIEYANLVSAARRAVESSHCLVLRSLSLFHALAGLRIGYGIGHPSLIDRLTSGSAPGLVNSMALAAARASVADKGYYKRTGEYLAGEKAYVLDKLKRLPGLTVCDTPCNFVLIGLENRMPDIAGAFLKRSIFIDTFADIEGKTWIRLPMRRRPQNARFAKTLKYLLSAPETG
jgi:threonine-phosphate decarboxylase